MQKSSVLRESVREITISETSLAKQLKTVPSPPALRVRPVLLLAGIAAFLCLHAELAVIEHIDGHSLYMTTGEIALDSGITLLIMLGIAAVWWLTLLAVVGVAKALPMTRRHSTALAWYLGLAVPFSYFTIDLFSAFKLWLVPSWSSRWFVWLPALVLCVIAVLRVRVARLQELCGARLAPIAWVHVVLAAVAVGGLWVHNAHAAQPSAQSPSIAATTPQPDIYLITFDALAAEETSLYGYHLPTTPNLERFAQRSFVFDDFFANSNFTASATTSMETGKLPWKHRIFQQEGFLRGASQRENLAAQLHERGYRTAMITSNEWAAPFRHHTLESYDVMKYEAPLSMVGSWFDDTNLIGAKLPYRLCLVLALRLSRVLTYVDALLWPYRYPAPAEPVFDRARTLLDHRDPGQPQFLWTHILPPHDPYLPPSLTRKHFFPPNQFASYLDFISMRNDVLPPGATVEELRGRYDEMVLYADTIVGNYVNWLDQTGRLDNSIVIISADHGESFEHHWFMHDGPRLYDSMIHVPLLIHLPGQKQGAHISQLGEQVDLLPTVLDLLGGTPPNWTDGTSLKPAIQGGTLPQRFIFSMNLESDRVFGPIANGTLSVRDDEFKYEIRLANRHESLYRYKDDPLEEHDLIASQPEVAKHLHDVLFDHLREADERYAVKP